MHGAMALMLVAPVVLVVQNRVDVATAGSGPGSPCPVAAPVKTFDVSAIDVDIPLNRFGDHDPSGQMYDPTRTSRPSAPRRPAATSRSGCATTRSSH